MVKIKGVIKDNEGNIIKDNVIVWFEEDEINLLEKFLTYAREIESCKIVQMDMPVKSIIHGNKKKETETETNFPDWELMLSYLMRLRPIILEDEKTNFYKICKTLSRRFDAPEIREMIKEAKKIYQGAKFQSFLRINIKGKTIKYGDIFNMYLNAHVYHRDDSKLGGLNKIESVLKGQTELYFYLLSVEKGVSILKIAEFVRNWVDSIKGIKSQPFNQLSSTRISLHIGIGHKTPSGLRRIIFDRSTLPPGIDQN